MGPVEERLVHQPLHPSMRSKLDPEYIALHDSVLQYIIPSEAIPWDPASRLKKSPIASSGQQLVDVGRTFDRDLGNFQIRVFIPEGEPPQGGWPALIWFHGGGWVIGGLGSENGFLRYVCKYVRCVVITVNYRHAPEHVYPTAVNDVVEGYNWVVAPENAEELDLDTSRIVIGGASAGGCLTAILSLKIAEGNMSVKPRFQLLICPVIDNTATVDGVWSTSRHAPWLTPSRMRWYTNMYFTDPASEASNWDASPNYASSSLLAKSPKTLIQVAECDLLGPEALAYGVALKNAGVETEVKVYKGATHSAILLAGAHKIGKQLVYDACETLARVLGTDYAPKTAPILPQ